MRVCSSPYRVALVAIAATVVALLSPASAGAATTSLGCADDPTGTTDLSSWVPEMLAATNAHRTSMGLVSLQLDPVLTRASVWKSRDMGRRNYFSHDDLALPGESARTPWERLTDCGWTKGGSRAENIAAGQSSGQAFVTAWLNSPGHRANIENATMRYVGFGVARVSGSRYGTYATQMFASVSSGEVTAPPPPPPPPPTPPTPAAPTLAQLTFAYEGSARLVCPASGSTDTWRVSMVTGQVDATNSGSCVRVAPRAGVGGITAYVDYHARNVEGGTSPNVRMTVTVDAAPPPPPPPTPPPPPAAPTVTSLEFAYGGPTQTVCPGVDGVSYALDLVEGWVVAGITDAGCLRVSPVTGQGGITAYVTYHARHEQGGLSSSVRMTITVTAAAAREPEPTPEPEPDPTPPPAPPISTTIPDPMPPAPTVQTEPSPIDPTRQLPTTDPTTNAEPLPVRWRGARVTIQRLRCRGPRAIRGWCWRATITGRLVQPTNTGPRRMRATILRRTAGGRFVRVGRVMTSRTGVVSFRILLRPPARDTAIWLARHAGMWRIHAGDATVTVRARR